MMATWTRAAQWLLFAAIGSSASVQSLAQTAPLVNSDTAQVIPGQIVVNEAARVIDRVKRDPGMASLIDNARAVLTVPLYGEPQSAFVDRVARAAPAYTTASALALTSNGSPGVFLMHGASGWSSPAFFNVANDGIDSQRGYRDNDQAVGVPVVIAFMTRKAVRTFLTNNAAHEFITNGAFSLSGLRVASYSADSRSSVEDADVVIWTPSDSSGPRWSASNEFYFNPLASDDYYRNGASLEQILSDYVATLRSTDLQVALASKGRRGG